MQTNRRDRYDPISQIFHWLTAIAVVIAFVLGPEGFGKLMRSGVDPATRSDIVWHETLGILVFALTLLRLIWVAVRPKAPKFLLSTWQHAASRLAQALLWLMLLALPVTALLTLASEGFPMTLLGGFRVEPIAAIALSALAGAADWGEVHGFLGDAILVMAGVHAAGAIFHHVVVKDGVLLSMTMARRAGKRTS
ncbi:MAG: cytochrome b/b6 domain-containing protein [Burkholderiaceae bacterium]